MFTVSDYFGVRDLVFIQSQIMDSTLGQCVVVVGDYEGKVLILEDVYNKGGGELQTVASVQDVVSPVRVIQVTPTGVLVIANSDEVIRLYDLRTLKYIGILEGHSSAISSIESYPGGNYLLSGSESGELFAWFDTGRTWMRLSSFKGHSSRIEDISVHPSRQFMVSIDSRGNLFLWDLVTCKTVSEESVESKPFRCSFSSDGQYLAFLSPQEVNVRKIEVKEDEAKYELKGESFTAFGWLNETSLICGTNKGNVLVIENGVLIQRYDVGKTRIKSICRTGVSVVAACSEGELIVRSIVSIDNQDQLKDTVYHNESRLRLTAMASVDIS